jgi:hypothetical protein
MRTHPHANRKPYEPNASIAQRISRQRQILQQLSTDYARQVEQLLGYRALMRGSLYRLHRRCGNPGCHCAQPGDSRHACMVLSWSQAGKTCLRSLWPADLDRVRRLVENHRQLRQRRRTLDQLHRQLLQAVDRFEQLLCEPAPPAKRPQGRPGS